MWYTVALFVHVLGAIGLFIAISLVVVAVARMRRASTLDQVRDWASVAQLAGKSIALIGLAILAPALYMVVVAWGFATPWVMAALVTFVVLAVAGATVNGRTIERVAAAAQGTESGPIPSELQSQLAASQLWLAEGARLGLLVGIVFLMTVKPDALGSLLVLASMLVLGLILGALAQRSRRRIPHKELRVGESLYQGEKRL